MTAISDNLSAGRRARSAALDRLFWRIHFWAGLIASPIILFAAVTGLIYVFAPQIEDWRHGHLDRVAATGQVLPLDAQVAAVRQAYPGYGLRSVVVPAQGATGETVRVFLRAPEGYEAHGAGEHGTGAAGKPGGAGMANMDHGIPTGFTAYVNPYTAEVLALQAEMDRFSTWAKKLHSSALQGNGWRWIIELGASWMLVLYATGLTLWWPRSRARGGPGLSAMVPRSGRGRVSWRDWHAVLSILAGVTTVIVLVTGLTWSRHTGQNFRDVQQATGQGAPRPPTGLESTPAEGGKLLGYQQFLDLWQARLPDVSLQITPPRGDTGTWRVENFDRGQPEKRFVLVADAYSGSPLFQAGWDKFPVAAKATSLGIPFHRGDFGWWNQALLVFSALAAIFSVVSGVVMWWSRRPRGTVAAPALPARTLTSAPLGWIVPLGAALAYVMPVFGWSLLVFAVLEGARLIWQRPRRHSDARRFGE